MMLDGASGIAVVGEATDGDEVDAAVDALHPDVVPIDNRMPRLDGIAANRTQIALLAHEAGLA